LRHHVDAIEIDRTSFGHTIIEPRTGLDSAGAAIFSPSTHGKGIAGEGYGKSKEVETIHIPGLKTSPRLLPGTVRAAREKIDSAIEAAVAYTIISTILTSTEMKRVIVP